MRKIFKRIGMLFPGFLFILSINVHAADPALTIYAFSAGAADAFLIRTENSSVMIDCAEKDDGKEIAEFLEENGINNLDYLIITHFDKDHIGGAAKVLHSVSVDHVLQSNCPKESNAYDKYLEALSNAGIQADTVTEDISFDLDGIEYWVDAPKGGYTSDESNNSSLIVSITNGDDTMLYMGDAEDERIIEFLNGHKDSYDFLKVPHHGRKGKTSSMLIDILQPEIAVITSSDEEKEDQKVVDWLEQAGADVYLTRIAPVVIESDGNEMWACYETEK